MSFQIKAKIFLKKCSEDLRRRVLSKVELLQAEPVPHDAKRVVGERGTFRIRIGDYRVIYDVVWEQKVILVAKIDKRSKVYQ